MGTAASNLTPDTAGAALVDENAHRVARTVDQVETLRDVWRDLPVRNVDADIDFYLAGVQHDPTVVRPHVIKLERPGGRVVLLVARVADRTLPLRVGYKTLANLRARTLVVSFDGLLGAESSDLAAVVEAVDDGLDGNEYDAVVFQQLESSSPIAAEVEAKVSKFRRAQAMTIAKHWSADLPSSWQAFLERRSAKSRRQIRYDDSKFVRKFGDSCQLRQLDAPEHRDRLWRDLEEVASQTYQRRLGVGTDGSERQRRIMETCLEHGWLRVWMLYIEDKPVSFWWGIAYAGVFSVHSPGYDPAFSKDRVGYYTMRRMLEGLCNDEAVSVLDFGHGDADYKERFATRCTESTDLIWFAQRPRALAVNVLLSSTAALTSLAKRFLGDSEKLTHFKRRWRARGADASPGASRQATSSDDQ